MARKARKTTTAIVAPVTADVPVKTGRKAKASTPGKPAEFRKLGEEAVKHWQQSTREEGLGDCFAVVALASFMEEAGELSYSWMSRKNDPKGNPLPGGNASVSLVTYLDHRATLKDPLRSSGLNKALSSVIFGLPALNMEAMQAFKARINRVFPAALAIHARAVELKCKVTEAFVITDQGLQFERKALPPTIDAKSVHVIEPGKVGKKLAPQQDKVTASVRAIAASAKPAETATTATGGAQTRTTATVPNVTSQASAFITSANILKGRLRAIVNNQAGSSLTDEETDALAALRNVMDDFDKHAFAKAKAAMAPAGETIKPAAARKSA